MRISFRRALFISAAALFGLMIGVVLSRLFDSPSPVSDRQGVIVPSLSNVRVDAQPQAGNEQRAAAGSLTTSSPSRGFRFHQADVIRPFNGNLQEALNRLKDKAAHDVDPETIVQLAVASGNCMSFLNAADQISDLEKRVMQGDKSQENTQLLAVYKAYRTQHLSTCAGFKRESFGVTDALLESAAASGNAAAQLEYAKGSSLSYLVDSAGILKNLQKTAEYRERSIAYLEGLAARGNAEAMMLASSIYDAGVLVDRDLVKSYAFHYAYLKGQSPSTLEKQLARLGSQLTAAQVTEARALGERMWFACCN